MEIQIIGLRFITSNSYFNVDEYELAKQYEICFNRQYFPKAFINVLNFDYEGCVPDIKYFNSNLDNPDQKLEKQHYVNMLMAKNYKWNFKRELIAYCEQRLWLLTYACIIFLKDCFECD